MGEARWIVINLVGQLAFFLSLSLLHNSGEVEGAWIRKSNHDEGAREKDGVEENKKKRQNEHGELFAALFL